MGIRLCDISLFPQGAQWLTLSPRNYAVGVPLEVKVRFFTRLREIVGKREETLQFGNAEKVTVDSVLKDFSKQYGRSFVEYLYDAETGQPRGFLQFLINGESAATLQGLETELHNGDVLAILPPVGGG